MRLMLSKSVPIGREALKTIPPPDKGKHITSSTYTPIPHGMLAEMVEAELAANNLTVVSQAHGLYRDGQRYFGLYELVMEGINELGLVLGIRNGYDGVIPAGIVLGTQVMVCDNLAFHGEEKIARRHTEKILVDLPGMVADAIKTILSKKTGIMSRVENYKKFEVTDMVANDLILRAATEFDVVPITRAPKVWKQWVAPNHPEFHSRNMWSLYNAFTEVMKASNTEDVVGASANIHKLLDNTINGVRLPIEGSAAA